MKRSGGLRRGQPLDRGTAQLKRSGIKAVGKRGRAHASTMSRLRPQVFRRDGFRCCVLLADGCSGRAENAHHLWPSERGGPDDLDNLISTCWPCHHLLHNGDPALARRLGFLRDGPGNG